MAEEYDHIVIGGGAAGCVAAARLVADGDRKVLLLEAGYSHHHPLLDMPPGIFKLINGSKYMTYHSTVPQEHLNGRVHDIPQGNVLGGGTSVNAQVYMRGRPSDYDEWDAILRGNNDGAPGTGRPSSPTSAGSRATTACSTTCTAPTARSRSPTPATSTTSRAGSSRACRPRASRFTHDFNGPTQRGVGFYQFMNRKGRRCSAAYAFVEPLKDDPRLTLRLRARVRRIEIENGRATGVTWADENGAVHTARARSDIVVTAGALVTPKLLMLSGIGPADHLARARASRSSSTPPASART